MDKKYTLEVNSRAEKTDTPKHAPVFCPECEHEVFYDPHCKGYFCRHCGWWRNSNPPAVIKKGE